MPPTKRKKIANKRGRQKLPLSRRKLVCSCGGKSGKGQCKMAVYCNICNMCKASCISNVKCVRVETPPPSPKKTRLATGCIIDNPGSLADISPCSTPASNHTLVTHTKLCLPSARLKDLSKAFGQSRSYQASTARRTIQVLNQSIKENNDDSKEEVKP